VTLATTGGVRVTRALRAEGVDVDPLEPLWVPGVDALEKLQPESLE